MTTDKPILGYIDIPDERVAIIERINDRVDQIKISSEYDSFNISHNNKIIPETKRDLVTLTNTQDCFEGFLLRSSKKEQNEGYENYVFNDVWIFKTQLVHEEVLKIAKKEDIRFLYDEKGISPVISISRGRLPGTYAGLKSYANIDIFTEQSKLPKTYHCDKQCRQIDTLLQRLGVY